MYREITDESPYETPMRIYPAPHYTMGGLWVDYNLQTTIPGLHSLGESNFSEHGANRLGASALMQGLCDGYFVIPYTIGNYLADQTPGEVSTEHDAFGEAEATVQDGIDKLLAVKGERTPRDFHWDLGRTLWDNVGMSRNPEGIMESVNHIRALREEYWQNVRVVGNKDTLNQALEYAGRVGDYLELGELIAIDAWNRNESCGCHLRTDHQTEEGEPIRNDDDYAYVAAWEYTGDLSRPRLNREKLAFDNVHLAVRNYK